MPMTVAVCAAPVGEVVAEGAGHSIGAVDASGRSLKPGLRGWSQQHGASRALVHERWSRAESAEERAGKWLGDGEGGWEEKGQRGERGHQHRFEQEGPAPADIFGHERAVLIPYRGAYGDGCVKEGEAEGPRARRSKLFHVWRNDALEGRLARARDRAAEEEEIIGERRVSSKIRQPRDEQSTDPNGEAHAKEAEGRLRLD
eukprot:scaffold343_cov120-Isochrysis_galbana.AAC.14